MKRKICLILAMILVFTTGYAVNLNVTPNIEDNGKINVETDAEGDYVAVKVLDDEGNIVYLGFEENTSNGKLEKEINVGRNYGTYTVKTRGSKDRGVMSSEISLDGIICDGIKTNTEHGLTEVGASVTSEAEIINIGDDAVALSLISAAYSGEGKLLGVKMSQSTVSVGKDILEVNMTVPEDAYQIKVFLWDDKQKPVTDVEVLVIPEKIFVSPTGNDEADGSIDAPLATIEKALEVASEKERRVNIILREGIYYQSDAIAMGEEHSGTVISGYEGETAVISGGTEISTESFTDVTDSEILERLPDETEENVKVADLSELGISGAGKINHINYHMGKPAFETLTIGGERGRLARWPNEGYAQVSSFVKNEFAKKENGSDDTVNAYKGEMEFTYSDDRADNWTADGTGWVIGYWNYSWAQDSMIISGINPDTNTITTKGASSMGTNASIPGGRWYAFNLLEELDSPGEWMIKDNMLYLYPPTGMEEENVVLSSKNINGLEINGAEGIVIRNLAVENYRGEGIRLTNCKNTAIDNLKIKNTSRWAVNVNGGSDCEVSSCEIYDLAMGGIRVNGGDKNTLESAGHRIIDNSIHDYGLEGRCYEPGIDLYGVGATVAHNEIYNAPHFGISFKGNEHVIEYNDIHDVVLETGDAGAIYCHGDYFGMGTKIRYNYIHDIELFYTESSPYIPGGAVGIYFDDQYSGVSAYGNVLDNCQHGFLFNAGRYAEIRGNIIMNVPSTKQNNSSIIAQSQTAEGFASTILESTIEGLDREIWNEKYPGILDEIETDYKAGLLLNPKGNKIIDNVICQHGNANITDSLEKYSTVYGNDVASYKKNIFVTVKAKIDEIVDRNGDYWKKIEGTSYESTVPDFEPIPFGQIGRLTK